MGEDAGKKRLEIALTRQRIDQTMDAIAYKTDVKSRLRENLNEKFEEAKDAVRRATDRAREEAKVVVRRAAEATDVVREETADAVRRATDAARETLKHTQE